MSITSQEYSSSECNDGPSSSSIVPWGKNSNSSGGRSSNSNKKDKHRQERKVREKRNLGLRLRLRRRLLGLLGQLGLLFGQLHSALIYVTIGFMMASSTEFWTGKQTSIASSDINCLVSANANAATASIINVVNEKHEPNPEQPSSSSSSTSTSTSSFVMDPYDAIVQAVEVRRLRVYTYPLPSSFNTDFNMTTATKTGNGRMVKAERRIHELFRSPKIATDNPNAADFFFVPVYPASACAYHKQRTCTSWNERPDCHGCKQGYDLIRQSIEYLQTHHVFRHYFSNNNGGEIHIFPVFYDHGICMETFLEDARRHGGKVPSAIQKSILLSFLGDDSYGCYRSGQDIVLPPFVDDVSQAVVVSQDSEAAEHAPFQSTTKPVSILGEEQPQLRQRQQEGVVDVQDSSSSNNRVSSKDRILMHFRGNTRLHPSSPTTRTRLVQQYGNEPGSIVSDEKVDTVQLHSELIRSRFCLVPSGFAPWSYRMVEAIQFECIPVLFDDNNKNNSSSNNRKDDLPFASIIDYDSMAVRVSSDDDDDSFSNLSNRLQAISHEAVAAKRAYIRRVKPLFSYYSKEFESGLMRELYKRRRSRLFDPTVGSTKRTVTSDPASSTTTTFNFDVDLVYTWVNGTDPEWATTRAEFQAKLTKGRPTGRGSDVNADSIANMRFRDREELRYSLRSIEKNAPWIRKVHIVVARGQNISWANIQHTKLNIVRHEDIFPAKNATLPTYNSFAIESFVDNIPGLSEHFVLMNDDFFIGRPVEKSSFFTFEGYPKVAFQDEWMTQSRVCRDDLKGSSANHTYLWAALNTYKLMDAAYGHEDRRLVMHQAYPLTKTLYRKAKRLFRKEFASTARNHFRTRKDIIPHFLALYTGFQDGTSVKLRPAEYLTNSKVQFGDNFEENEEMIRSFNQTDYDVFFINDHTSDEASEEDIDRLTRDLQSWMASMFPTPSQFEKKA